MIDGWGISHDECPCTFTDESVNIGLENGLMPPGNKP